MEVRREGGTGSVQGAVEVQVGLGGNGRGGGVGWRFGRRIDGPYAGVLSLFGDPGDAIDSFVTPVPPRGIAAESGGKSTTARALYELDTTSRGVVAERGDRLTTARAHCVLDTTSCTCTCTIFHIIHRDRIDHMPEHDKDRGIRAARGGERPATQLPNLHHEKSTTCIATPATRDVCDVDHTPRNYCIVLTLWTPHHPVPNNDQHNYADTCSGGGGAGSPIPSILHFAISAFSHLALLSPPAHSAWTIDPSPSPFVLPLANVTLTDSSELPALAPAAMPPLLSGMNGSTCVVPMTSSGRSSNASASALDPDPGWVTAVFASADAAGGSDFRVIGGEGRAMRRERVSSGRGNDSGGFARSA